MRRIVVLAATAALAMSALGFATASAIPPVPTMTIAACRVDPDTMRVTVTWSALPSTGGEMFIDTIPPDFELGVIWNQKGKHGTHVEEFEITGRVIDSVVVNLYDAKRPGFFEQRQLGDDDEVEFVLPPC